MTAEGQVAWQRAALAAALFAVDPDRLKGVAVRAKAGPVRDRWLDCLCGFFPEDTPFRKLPLNATDDSLFGGIDVTATLAARHVTGRSGMLSSLNGGVMTIPLAERLDTGLAARLGAVLDSGDVIAERDGLSFGDKARFGIVAYDESEEDEDGPPHALLDRLALHIDLTEAGIRDIVGAGHDRNGIAKARELLPFIEVSDDIVAGLCRASITLGIGSLRGPILTLHAARASAALNGRISVTREDAAAAAMFVLAPRATVAPPSEAPAPNGDNPAPGDANNSSSPAEDGERQTETPPGESEIAEAILASAQAALPPGLLGGLGSGAFKIKTGTGDGRSGSKYLTGLRGRPAGTRPYRGTRSERIALLDTLRTAAPWQAIRRAAGNGGNNPRLEIRRTDLRARRFIAQSQTTTVFAVDASGSTALQRLAEAKGAVELLLADCYVRRDRVALIVFRGQGADLVLPPTRSLVRAKRALASLAGGGGTPLATGLVAAVSLSVKIRRGGGSPLIVLLTDGKANVGVNGEGGRERARADAIHAARAIRAATVPALLVDTSPRPQPAAESLAAAMAARYLPLPYADAKSLSQAARSLAQS